MTLTKRELLRHAWIGTSKIEPNGSRSTYGDSDEPVSGGSDYIDEESHQKVPKALATCESSITC